MDSHESPAWNKLHAEYARSQLGGLEGLDSAQMVWSEDLCSWASRVLLGLPRTHACSELQHVLPDLIILHG